MANDFITTSTVFGHCSQKPDTIYPNSSGPAGRFQASGDNRPGTVDIVAYSTSDEYVNMVLLIADLYGDTNLTKVAFLPESTPIDIATVDDIFSSPYFGPATSGTLGIDGKKVTIEVKSEIGRQREATATFTITVK
ncbi:hypothetical protein L218DRAFT_1007453 [Marasmius fiardii PR-910]|nr:hypothetical protein L218DRAFT_1007453 [Marasmius fiardii PR-910]